VKTFDNQRNAMPNCRRLKTASIVVVARSLRAVERYLAIRFAMIPEMAHWHHSGDLSEYPLPTLRALVSVPASPPFFGVAISESC